MALPLFLYGRLHLLFENLPSVRISDVVEGAFLTGDVVMTDNVPLGIEAEFPAQPGGEAHQGIHSNIVEAPFRIGVANFNGNSVVVPVAGTVSHFADGNALKDFAVQPNDKVGAGIGFAADGKTLKVAAVGRGRGAGVADIMNDDGVDLFDRDLGTGYSLGVSNS